MTNFLQSQLKQNKTKKLEPTEIGQITKQNKFAIKLTFPPKQIAFKAFVFFCILKISVLHSHLRPQHSNLVTLVFFFFCFKYFTNTLDVSLNAYHIMKQATGRLSNLELKI